MLVQSPNRISPFPSEDVSDSSSSRLREVEGRWKRLADAEDADVTYKTDSANSAADSADTASTVLWIVIGVFAVIIVLLCACLIGLIRMMSQINIMH